MAYTYQPTLSAVLQPLRVPNKIVHGAPHVTPDMISRVTEDLSRVGMTAVPFAIDAAAYHQYFCAAQYPADYYAGNLPEKSLEHFLALQFLRLDSASVFVDVASEHSVLPAIASRLTGCTAYSQDIMYDPGINGERIGGDACAMPVPDGFATHAALTCSLEHFEGDADTRLFIELARVLQPGGRVVVVPLYMLDHPAVLTDPRYAAAANVVFDPDATVYAWEGWSNRHGRFYSPETLVERVVSRVPQFQFTVYRLLSQDLIHPSIYARLLLLGERAQ